MTTPFPFVASQVLTAQQLNDIQNLPISDKTASYTLIAGDETKRTMMNNASATTITVNNSIFTVGDVIQVANKGAGTCTITAGAGVTINTSGSLALAQYGGGYLVAISASSFVFFNLGGGSAYGTATGGSSSSITVGGINYTLLTFTSTGTLTVTKAGFFDYLLVGAGSGCLYCGATFPNGGGGAGAITSGSVYLSANTTITIGAGGSFTTADATLSSGGDTSIDGTAPIAISASGSKTFTQQGLPAVFQGSGSGASRDNTVIAVTSKQGFNGGDSGIGSPRPGGGGGGSAAVGGAGNTGANTGGAGGAGTDVSNFIGGSALFKASGGGGAATTAGTAGLGGSSLGNDGTKTTTGTNGGANTGCGGGGANSVGGVPIAGNGGSGIAYIRFK